jgi:hypothetical protein
MAEPVVVVVDAEEDKDDDDDDDGDDPAAGDGTFDRAGCEAVHNALNPVQAVASSAASTKRDARPPPASFYQDRIAPPEGMGLIADSAVDFASKLTKSMK